MRNLSLQGERRCFLTLSAPGKIAALCDIVDSHDRERVVLSQEGLLSRCKIDSYGAATTVWVCDLNKVVAESTEGAPVETSSDWAHLFLVQDDKLIVLNKTSGAMVSVSLESAEETELVGEFEEGIAAAAWSPQEEVLWIVTFAAEEDGNAGDKRGAILLTLNAEWHVLSEMELEGQILRNEKVHLAYSPTHPSHAAISSVDAVDDTRKVRIYHTQDSSSTSFLGRTEDGSGKLAPNLQSSDLAWAGPGCSQLIATVQRKGRKTQQIAFFEPNGLRHGQFPLRCSETTSVIAMEWNADSNLLAIALREGNNAPDRIQLWHRSNYHWYLKREIVLSGAMQSMYFHQENPYVLWVAFTSSTTSEHELQWTEYDFGWQASTVSSLSTSYVVDGATLNMTPLSQSLVPPPMCSASIDFAAPISEILPYGQDHAVVLLSNGSLSALQPKSNGLRWRPPEVAAKAVTIPEDSNIDPMSLRNVVVVSVEDARTLFIAAGWDRKLRCEVLVVLSMGSVIEGETKMKIQSSMTIPGIILCIAGWSDTANSGALVQLEDGQLLEFEVGSDGSIPTELAPSPAEPLLEPCPVMAALKNPADPIHHSSHDTPSRIVVGMSKRGRLYCHDVLLADSVSSFGLSSEHQYLVYVTIASQCVLRFVHFTQLTAAMDPFLGSDENQLLLQGYEPRHVERGSRLVAVFHDKPVAVLQMPRGNLEAVYPRALVLGNAMKQILREEVDFRAAFELMRRQKVDLNLLVDMDPELFLREGVEEFIDQVKKIDHLNLFVSSLQNWDSTAERYPVPKWIRKSSVAQVFDFSSKVNQVCRKMRSVMIEEEKRGSTSGGREVKEGEYLLPILSTFAKEDPPRLEDALLLIKENAERHPNPVASSKPLLFSDAAQHSIQYLAFLAEYELLFSRALGLYDYDLARAVARNSQMDPKVYLPMLKRYRELPYHYARYEVDMRLKRHEAALRNLSESRASREVLDGFNPETEGDVLVPLGNTLDDCMRLIDEEQLHRLGLELFQDPPSVRRIMLSLGNVLLKQDKAEAALSVFLATSPPDLERALHAAKSSLDWVTYFNLASGTADWNSDRQHLAAHEIANTLATRSQTSFGNRRKQMENASRVLLDYGEDPLGAIDMLLKAEMWAEAQRVAQMNSLDSHKCLEEAVSYSKKSILELEGRLESFQETMERYLVVLKIRKEAIASGEEEHDLVVDDMDDSGSLFSAASTTASNASVRSTGSVGSLSSVISVKSTTTFSLSGAEETHRHNSKYNQLGANKKKKKKRKKTGRVKTVPGSQAELLELVQALRYGVVDDVTLSTIADTIVFLSRNKQMPLARTLFNSYVALSQHVAKSREDRLESARVEKIEQEARARREGTDGQPPISLDAEREVDALECVSLPESVRELFDLLPESAFPCS